MGGIRVVEERRRKQRGEVNRGEDQDQQGPRPDWREGKLFLGGRLEGKNEMIRHTAKNQDSSAGSSPLLQAAAGFHSALDECIQTGDKEAVHRVRTGSRRVQAILEATVRQNGAFTDAAKAWLRPLKQVRRAAGEVRDLDVHRGLLEQYVGKHPEPLASQAKRLDHWLAGERRDRERRMAKQMKKRQEALAEAQAAFLNLQDGLPKGRRRATISAETVAVEDFIRAVDLMPVLDAENLHDFRKATKKARYVAESGATGVISKALKRVQDAIGEWHDWFCLQQEAKLALKDEAPELKALLEHEVEQHFAIAMKTTQTVRARLTGEWMAKRPSRPVVLRRSATG
jgi:CHAD domain-containing protein